MLGRTQQQTYQMRAEDPVKKIYACSTNPPQKANGSTFCSSQQWHNRRLVCDYRSQLCPTCGPHVAQSKVFLILIN